MNLDFLKGVTLMERRCAETGRELLPGAGGRDSQEQLLKASNTGCEPPCVPAVGHPVLIQ